MNTTTINSFTYSNMINLGYKLHYSLDFSNKNLEPKLFNGWFSGNTTNICIKK